MGSDSIQLTAAQTGILQVWVDHCGLPIRVLSRAFRCEVVYFCL